LGRRQAARGKACTAWTGGDDEYEQHGEDHQRAPDSDEEPSPGRHVHLLTPSLMSCYHDISQRDRGLLTDARRLVLSTMPALSALEARGLDVFSPFGAQGVADFAERGFGSGGREHRFDHVAVGPREIDHFR
jgi:hypothetical protein